MPERKLRFRHIKPTAFPKRKSRHICAQEWMTHKDAIVDLYMKGLTQKSILLHMKKEHCFEPS